MDRVYGANVSQNPPIPPFPGSFGSAQGSPDLTQLLSTYPGAFWYHYITESMRNVVVAAGLTPDPANLTQFYEAVAIIIAAARS